MCAEPFSLGTFTALTALDTLTCNLISFRALIAFQTYLPFEIKGEIYEVYEIYEIYEVEGVRKYYTISAFVFIV